MRWTLSIVSSYLFWLSLSITVLFAVLKADTIFLRHITPRADLDAFKDLNIPSRSFPTTYLSDSSKKAFKRIISAERHENADTTAIILNWSRLPNVIRIVSLLCDTRLEDSIAQIVVWNNSPKKLGQRDFSSARCSSTKLKIYNSPQNLYFQARFIACAGALTPYCFIQDDDYLVYPEIIQALRARITLSEGNNTGIHLLPPQEHLSSTLRSIVSNSHPTAIHTSFAWLGHGAILLRSSVLEFLSLMGPLNLNASVAEMKMADNFYTLLSNTATEIWFDHGVELGGGQAFTVGEEGLERNRRFIRRAGEYLDSIVLNGTAHVGALPFVNVAAYFSQKPVARTPCLNSLCLLETTIPLLPSNLSYLVESATDLLALEEYNLGILGEARQFHYSRHPLSNAVDGRPDTAFCSPEGAHSEDIISLDMLSSLPREWSTVEMVWLVDTGTEAILKAGVFETSVGGVHWTSGDYSISCSQANLFAVPEPNMAQPLFLRECSMQLSVDSHEVENASGPRIFRVKLEEDHEEKWCIYEVWLRGTNQT